ncbi:SH3 domain-containing protein [Streptomyces sp. NPDC054835]|uniref:SH3 domain-containing protein n=1 Tax=Streptomyces exfoliatus TaxID=1905 RepID=UPI0004B9647E|nr:SH3 domain-containing protein [Streptomyces exfoliatus]
MRFTRAALCAVALASVAVPAAASAATAATTTAPAAVPLVRDCDRPGPWTIGTSAVKIRKSPSTSATAVGILYKGHRFTVHSSRSGWHYITDTTTGVKGWVSGTYVYREVRMCLD